MKSLLHISAIVTVIILVYHDGCDASPRYTSDTLRFLLDALETNNMVNRPIEKGYVCNNRIHDTIRNVCARKGKVPCLASKKRSVAKTTSEDESEGAGWVGETSWSTGESPEAAVGEDNAWEWEAVEAGVGGKLVPVAMERVRRHEKANLMDECCKRSCTWSYLESVCCDP